MDSSTRDTETRNQLPATLFPIFMAISGTISNIQIKLSSQFAVHN